MISTVEGQVSLDHCVVASTDLDRSDAFYSCVLGAVITRPMENLHQYRFGSQMLNVHGPGLAAKATPDLLARLPVAPGGSDLCFEWKGSEDALARHLAECGVPITIGPVKREGARGFGTSVYFRDPDGSLLEFIIYPTESPAVL